MNIIHRITFRTDGPATNDMKAEGIKIGAGLINAFDIGENDKKWPFIQDAIKLYGTETIGDFQYKTVFTKKEIEGAKFFVLSPKMLFEYPQPADDFGYRETTYSPGVGCRKCNVGLEQQNPFSIKKAPKWGRRNILQLNWVLGEHFVSKEIKQNIEMKCPDITFLEVFKFPQNKPLDDIFQIIVKRHVKLEIPEEQKFEICSTCNNKKYVPHTRGFFPKPSETNFSIAKSKDFFGSGGSARQEMIISKEIYEIFHEAKMNGVDFIPCA